MRQARGLLISSFDRRRKLSELAKALAKAQSEFTPVIKDNTADTGKFSYQYADLATILSMALPILNKHGIFFNQGIKVAEGKQRIYTRLMLGAEVLESDGVEIPASLGPQDFGKYHSYYRRYDACAMLGIAPEADTYANDQGATITKSRSGQPAPPPKKATPIIHQPPQGVQVAPAPKFEADEADVPSSIGDPPNKTEMGLIKEALRKLEVDNDLLKPYCLKVTGKTAVKDITRQEWHSVIETLTEAKAKGTIKTLVA
jgi:hypothetical protein